MNTKTRHHRKFRMLLKRTSADPKQFAIVKSIGILVAISGSFFNSIAFGQHEEFELADVNGSSQNKQLAGISKEWYIFRSLYDDKVRHEYSKSCFTPYKISMSKQGENQAYLAGLINNDTWTIGLIDIDLGEWVNRLDLGQFDVWEIEFGGDSFLVLGDLNDRCVARLYSSDLNELIGEVDIDYYGARGADPSVWWDVENKRWVITTISPLTTGQVVTILSEKCFIDTSFVDEKGQRAGRTHWTVKIEESEVGVSTTAGSAIVTISYPRRTVLLDAISGEIVEEIPIRRPHLQTRESAKWDPASGVLYAIVDKHDGAYLQQFLRKGELIGEVQVPSGEAGLLLDGSGAFTVKKQVWPYEGSFSFFAKDSFSRH